MIATTPSSNYNAIDPNLFIDAQSQWWLTFGSSSSITGPFVDRNGTAMSAGGGTEILAGHGSIHGPGPEAVFADTDGDILMYHYYADDGSSKLGLNLLGWDAANWPFVH